MSLRDLPSVDHLLKSEPLQPLIENYGRSLVLAATRATLESTRERIRGGHPPPTVEDLTAHLSATLESWLEPTLLPVINASGVILHTNLGRAPLSDAATAAALAAASQYSNLEFDLEAGGRGHRDQHAEGLLVQLTGAEAALIVNNNAGAVLLALTGLAHGKEVLISRTQLIEIGGGFRIPEVLKQSGAQLVEVGTTNRTHLRDFEAALSERTGAVLRAHHSNFQLVGFTAEPSLAELVQLTQRAGVPLVDDLGSGAVLATEEYGLTHEPTVQDSLQAGAPLVTFSGDKLLGGPQAGLLVGERSQIDRLRRHPLARALRPDKLCLAALVATLTAYLRSEAETTIPVWRMISAQPAALRARTEGWVEALGRGEVRQAESTVGGGSLPGESLPTWCWAYPSDDPQGFLRRLRSHRPPVIGRIEKDTVLLDPRTVLPDQDSALLAALTAALEADA